MAIKSKNITTGITIWLNPNKPDSAWLSLGKKKAAAFVAINAVAILFLQLIPAPWGQIATLVATKNNKQIKKNFGPNGVWIKMSLIVPYVESRPRTAGNKNYPPNPW